jgi:putative ABC transport system permease protein
MNVYASDTTDKIVQVHPSTVFAKISAGMGMPEGMESEMQGMSAMTGSNQMDVWVEMLDNPELLEKQYDVIAGKMPELYNEVVLIVDDNNEVSDYALYALGLKDQDEVTETMKKLMQGEKIEATPVSYTYEEILSLTFKLLLNTDYFEKTADGWADRSADEDYLRAKLANATEIRVVGILRPAANSNMGAQTGAIGFLPSLTEYLIRQVNDSDIVRAQLADPERDIFTGITFEKPEEIVWTMDSLMAFIASLPEEESVRYTATIAQMKQSGMPDEQIVSMFASAMTPPTTDATYEGNLARLGVSDLSKPSSILIYPKDFEAKETLSELIKEYNAAAEDADQIQYTDYIGLLLSSVTTVINAISYILIAFVAISLVVSSIMIGIITYISVLERTKEIGILRSIGASKRDVSRVFNAETLTVGFVAGGLGIFVTVVLDLIASVILEAITGIGGLAALPWQGAIILILISMVLTFIAGLIPAGLAAKKDPVVALRSE